MSPKVIVSGGAGFIGSHVVRRLLSDGCTVTVLDNLTEYGPADETAAISCHHRAKHLLDGAEILRVDVTDAPVVRETLEQIQPTHVVHLAGTPLVSIVRARPREARESIVGGTSNMLEATRRCESARRFVYVSSSMAYGNFAASPMQEKGPPATHRALRRAETGGRGAGALLRPDVWVPTTIGRPTSVYGRRTRTAEWFKRCTPLS
jgi:nucleoside-diphosphate-sugar epimerase